MLTATSLAKPVVSLGVEVASGVRANPILSQARRLTSGTVCKNRRCAAQAGVEMGLGLLAWQQLRCRTQIRGVDLELVYERGIVGRVAAEALATEVAVSARIW